MHGLGNDFIIIDNVTHNYHLNKQQIIKLCHRHFGIGCDQLLIIESSSSKNIDFKYRIFNGDGSEVQQCGNGARCFALYVHEKGLSNKETLAVETLSGTIYLTLQKKEKEVLVKVDMGAPNFQPENLPLDLKNKNLKYNEESKNYQLSLIDKKSNIDKNFVFSAVSMGNPHITLIVEDITPYDVINIGKQLANHAAFPQGVNVGFMQILDINTINLRVYERGAGETLACGSGACAAVANGIKQGVLTSPVKVQLSAGYLTIKWDGDIHSSVYMNGPASFVFEGQIEV